MLWLMLSEILETFEDNSRVLNKGFPSSLLDASSNDTVTLKTINGC